MSKTPYEIRLELLDMARSILIEQTMNERIRLENNWGTDCEKAREIADRTGTAPSFPSFPIVPMVNADEVIAMAERLNAFVSKNT